MSRPYSTLRIRGRRIRLCHRSSLETTRRERRVEGHWLFLEGPQPNRTKLQHLGLRVYGSSVWAAKLATSPVGKSASGDRLDGPRELAVLQTPSKNKSKGGTIYCATKRLQPGTKTPARNEESRRRVKSTTRPHGRPGRQRGHYSSARPIIRQNHRDDSPRQDDPSRSETRRS